MKKDQEDFYVPRQTKMIEIAEFFADEKALQEGFKKGSKKWEKAKKEFLDEALYDSILPHNTVYGKKAMNPSMSETSKELFEGKFKEKRLLGIISQITNYYFSKILGKKVRGTNPDDNYTFVSFPKNASPLQIRQAYINRYKRDLYIAIISAMMVKAFSISESELDSVLEKTGILNDDINELKKKENKNKFSEVIYSHFLSKLNQMKLFDEFK